MIWALVELIKQEKVLRAVGKALVMLLNKKSVTIPKELEDLSSE
jgi:hypothetical protein